MDSGKGIEAEYENVYYISTKKCPVCKSTNVTDTTCVPDSGCWAHYFDCLDCKAKLILYEGDKMGGQFDSIYHRID